MGAFAGGLTFRHYYVNQPLPAGFKDVVQQGIEANAFKEIDPKGEEERAVGWCSAAFPLDIELVPEMYLFNEYIVLGMRVDTLTVPGPLLKIMSEAQTRRVMHERKRDSLSRYEKAEIKEQVKRELRQKLFPSIKTIDAIWSLEQGVVRFFSGNEKANLEFMELFEQSFGMTLTPDSAYTSALHGGLNLTEAEMAALELVEPSTFVDAQTAVAAMKEV